MHHFPKTPKYRFKHPSAKNSWKYLMKNSKELREKLGCKTLALSFSPILTWNSILIKQIASKKKKKKETLPFPELEKIQWSITD